jgi:amidohydrolase
MNKIKEEICSYIDNQKETILQISHKIWEFAELSLKEYKSAETYINALKSEGFDVKEKLCGIDTAFSGSFGSGKPVIGILGEFDALSGLSQKGCSTEKSALFPNGSGHGCGHNMLGAASFGAALGIKKYLESTGKTGTVIFFGCPGEEGGASKALMARDGVWKNLSAALTWHPGDTNEVTVGTCNSCVQVIYSFHGVASHAAGDPENGRSALDALELMNVGVQFLREHMKSDARIHYSILDAGGPSPNVVQPEAKVLYMIRSERVKDVLELEKRVDKIAEGASLMTETSFDKQFVDGCSTTLPNRALDDVIFANLQEVPLPQYTDEEQKFAAELKKHTLIME